MPGVVWLGKRTGSPKDAGGLPLTDQDSISAEEEVMLAQATKEENQDMAKDGTDEDP
jgi:hypothetical protein